MKEEKDSKPMNRCEEKRNEWARHWPCDANVQNQVHKLWKNKEMKKLEDALHGAKREPFGECIEALQSKDRLGCDGFHAKVPLDLTRETSEEVAEFLEKVEQTGKWPQYEVCCERAANRADAFDDRLVGSFQGARSGEMSAQVSY